MELKEGYKQMEIGVIPEDWDEVELSEIVEQDRPISYGIVQTGPQVLNGVKCIRVVDLINGGVDEASLITTTKEISNSYSKTLLKEGDLVMALRGKIGELSIINKTLEGANLTRGVALIAVKSTYSNKYIRYQINSPSSKRLLENRLNGSALKELSLGVLRRVPVVLPPTLAEQTAIATTLSDMDALITSLEQLIAKKLSIKQGVMQELLTGKRRLPGFGGEWISTEFGQVMEGFSSGQTPYRAIKDYYKGSIPWITSGELNYNVVRDTNEKITEGAVQKTNLKILPVGTFLMAITGLEATGTRGSCAITGVEATTNQSCMALFPKADKLTTSYLFHYYVFAGNELALKYCQGTKQQSYTGSLAKKLPISLPSSIEEQQAISSVLDDLDTEITALTQKLTKLQVLKQGMMQNLLTGKIRLI